MQSERPKPGSVHPGLAFPQPPAGFDPTEAPPEQLRHFGLPPRPDQISQKKQLALYRRYFEPPIEFVKPDVEVLNAIVEPSIRPFLLRLAPSGRTQRSRNWSGCYIAANRAKTFVALLAEWVVPEPRVPPGATSPPSGRIDTYACTTWIGLDGQRRYVDSSLPQVGTYQGIRLRPDGSKELDVFAWFQWWVPGNFNNTYLKFTELSLAPRDRVACMVQVWSPSAVVVYAWKPEDGLKRLAHRLIGPSADVTLPRGHAHTPTVSGATAEWILERPTAPMTSVMAQLPAFEPVVVSNCVAFEAEGHAASFPWVVGSPQVLDGANFIRMFDAPSKPLRTRLIAAPQRVKQSDTSVTLDAVGPAS